MASNFLPQPLQMYSKIGITHLGNSATQMGAVATHNGETDTFIIRVHPARKRLMSSTDLISHPSNFARIANDFVPRRFLRGGHAQTIAGNFMKRANGLPEPEARLFPI